MASIIDAIENSDDCDVEASALDFVSDNVSPNSKHVEEGERNNTVFDRAVDYFKKGFTEDDVLILVQNFNRRECDPPLSENELTRTVKSASRYKTTVAGQIVFPPIVKAITDPDELPPLQPELIEGVLRKGAYMALVGASKMGKSFLLIDLAVCIQNGLKWLNFQCAKGRVLYVNLEIEENSFMKRVNTIYQKYDDFKNFECFDILNLRGFDVGIEQLQAKLDELEGYDVFIIDPQYKVNAGDENSASEQGAFFNHIDHIATTHKTSVVICHHHSKGKQTSKRAIDRASGSGVMGRAVDALLDITHLENVDAPANFEGAKAIVLTPELRDFPELEPIGLWWQFPYHYIDESGAILCALAEEGGQQTKSAKEAYYREAIEELMAGKDEVTLKDLRKKTGKSPNTVKDWVERLPDFKIEGAGGNKSPQIVRVSK